MRDLTQTTDLHRQQLESEAPWIWLYEIQTNDSPPQRYRLTNALSRVQFGQNSAGDPLVYYPAPIVHGPIESTTDGSLPSMSITIANTGPIMSSVVDSANGFTDQPARIILVSSLELDNTDAAITENGEVVSVSIARDAITFKVSAFNLFQQQFPPFIFVRRRCRWIYGSAECGYNVNASGAAFDFCPRTVEACEERGDDEVARGLTRQHPARFGGWPGIPRVGRS